MSKEKVKTEQMPGVTCEIWVGSEAEYVELMRIIEDAEMDGDIEDIQVTRMER